MAKGFSTRLIHRGEGTASSLTTPIYETTTFVFNSADEVRQYNEGGSPHFLYSRYENPTVVAAEEKLAAADGADAALAFGSGMAASSTLLLAYLASGDEVVCSAAIYGGTLHLLADFLPKFGIRTRFVGLDELREPERVIGERTKIVWFETPINPTLRCVDIRRVAAACRERKVMSVIDNTFASPVNQRPLEMGIDLSMQSATKYLNGHSDVTAGAIVGSRELVDRLVPARKLVGALLDPAAASSAPASARTPAAGPGSLRASAVRARPARSAPAVRR